jgi:hypothetical protein
MISGRYSRLLGLRIAHCATILLPVLFLSACAEHNAQQNYAYNVLNRPDPHDESERIVECGWLGGEKARQQNLGDNGSGVSAAPRMAAYYRIVTNDNIGIIQARMNYLKCDKPPQMTDASFIE